MESKVNRLSALFLNLLKRKKKGRRHTCFMQQVIVFPTSAQTQFCKGDPAHHT